MKPKLIVRSLASLSIIFAVCPIWSTSASAAACVTVEPPDEAGSQLTGDGNSTCSGATVEIWIERLDVNNQRTGEPLSPGEREWTQTGSIQTWVVPCDDPGEYVTVASVNDDDEDASVSDSEFLCDD